MAKTLYLVRHAKSDWHNNLSDFDRPLNKRGLHDAPRMGQRLHERSVQADILLCSPAQRTRQTVELILRELGGSMNDVRFKEEIYEASTEMLTNLIRSLPDSCTSAILIGHNPSIGWLARELSNLQIDRMPTCAIATIELATDVWEQVGTCRSRLLDFDYPKRDRKRSGL